MAPRTSQLLPGAKRRFFRDQRPADESRGGPLEGADQALDPRVVGLKRVLADDGLAFRVVQLQVDPVHAEVLALQVCLTDELAAQPAPAGGRPPALAPPNRPLAILP